MSKVHDFEVTSIDFLLFNGDSGACTRLNKITQSNSDTFNEEINLIEKIILSNNFELHTDFINIAENFLNWSSNFVIKILIQNIRLDFASKILNLIDHVHGMLPINSDYLTKPLLKKESIIDSFLAIQQNFKSNASEYVTIFSKMCTTFEKELRIDNVFVAALVCIYTFLTVDESLDVIPALFSIAERILASYCRSIKTKIGCKIIIHELISIMKVVVRSKDHAISRLNFWWQVICAIDAQLMCTSLFEPCVVPYLANLFGKYITLDSGEKYSYSLSNYNCFNNYSELGALCNHSLSQLLYVVGDFPSHNSMKSSKYDNINHWRLFAGLLFTDNNVNSLLIGFYFWCQTMSLHKSKTLPSMFDLLHIIYNCFSKRFIIHCQMKQQQFCRNDLDEKNLTPTFYLVVEKIMFFTKHLNQDFVESHRKPKAEFDNYLKIMKCIIDSFHSLGDITSFSPAGLKLLLKVLSEHLANMNRLMLSMKRNLSKEESITWFESTKKLIDITFPKSSMAFSLIMSHDMASINSHWFSNWLSFSLKPEYCPIDRHYAAANLQCWYHLTSKLSQRLDKDSFIMYSDTVSNVNLTPFTEYLCAPIYFINELQNRLLTKNDYEELWKIWEHLYIDLFSKAQLLPNFSSIALSQPILSLITKLYMKVMTNPNDYMNNSVVVNMMLRCMRLIVLRSEDCEFDESQNSDILSDNPLWLLLKNLCEVFPVFTNDNVKISFRESSKESNKNIDTSKVNVIFESLLIPNCKLTKLKLLNMSQFNCDLDSNYDTFLSVLKGLIFKIGRTKSMMLDIAELLGSKLNILTPIIIGKRKRNTDDNGKYSRPRSSYDENATQLENFLLQFLSRVHVFCCKDGVTSSVVKKLTPFLLFIFSTENKALSRSTIQSCINFWNDSIGSVDDIEYPLELFQAIKILKLNNKTIVIPHSMESKMNDLEVNYSLVRKDSADVSISTDEETKTVPGKAPLERRKPYRVTRSSSISTNILDNDKNALNKPTEQKKIDENEINAKVQPNDGQIASKSPAISQETNKEFSSPSLNILRRTSRKRTCFDLTRKSSDADYVFIAPIKNKRCRLTEHQKEKFLENQNEYKPIGSVDLDNIPKFSLITQDSETTLSISSEDYALNRIDSTDIDRAPTEIDSLRSNSSKPVTDSKIPLETTVENNSPNLFNSDDKTEIITHENIFDSFVNTNSSNSVDIDQPSQADVIGCESTFEPRETFQTTEIEIENNTTQKCDESSSLVDGNKTDIVPPIENVNALHPIIDGSSVSTEISATRPTINCQEMTNSPISAAKKSLSITLTRSPIANSMSQRTQKLVKLALENQTKKEKVNKPIPPVSTIPNSAEKVKPPSIIRHFWSERKKDVHVSFSIPSDNDVDKENVESNSDLLKITCSENPDINSSDTDRTSSFVSFLSPVAERSHTSASDLPKQLCIDLNNSLMMEKRLSSDWEGQSLDSTRQTLEDIVNNFSPITSSPQSLVDRTYDCVTNALNSATDDEKKILIKRLMAFLVEQI